MTVQRTCFVDVFLPLGTYLFCESTLAILDSVRPGLLIIKPSLKDKCLLLSTPSIYESLNMTTTFQLLLDIYCTCIHCLTKLGVWYIQFNLNTPM